MDANELLTIEEMQAMTTEERLQLFLELITRLTTEELVKLREYLARASDGSPPCGDEGKVIIRE